MLAPFSLFPNLEFSVPRPLFPLFPPSSSRKPTRGREGRERSRPSRARLSSAFGMTAGSSKQSNRPFTRGCCAVRFGFSQGLSARPPQRVGVADRITISGGGTRPEGGRKSPARTFFIDQAVPDCGRISCKCKGGSVGADSDRGAGTGISEVLAAQSQFRGSVQS